MANAHLFSAGMELPNQGIEPVVALVDKDHPDTKHDIELAPMRPGAGDVMQEEDMPEGPPTTRAEEWS